MPPFPCIPIPLLFTIGWQDTSLQPCNSLANEMKILETQRNGGSRGIWFLIRDSSVYSFPPCFKAFAIFIHTVSGLNTEC